MACSVHGHRYPCDTLEFSVSALMRQAFFCVSLLLVNTAYAEQVQLDPPSPLTGLEIPNVETESDARFIELARQDFIYEWVRLKSGEWLKGEIKGYFEDELEFESDVLDTLFIEDEDINSIISSRYHSIKLKDGSVLNGPLDIIDGVGSFLGNPNAFTFDDVLTIAYAESSGINIWDIKISVGVNYSSGNTDQNEWTAQIGAKRRTADSRLLLDLFSTRSVNNEIVTEQNSRLSGTFDVFYTQKIFFRPLLLDYQQDPFKNLKAKYYLGAGVGYYFIDTKKTEWDVSIGPGYQKTEFETVEEGQSPEETSFSAFLETNFETELTKSIDLEFTYNYDWSNQESGGARHNAIATVEFDITDDIDFDVSVVWDRQTNPQPNSDGIIPEKDDYRIVIAIGMEI